MQSMGGGVAALTRRASASAAEVRKAALLQGLDGTALPLPEQMWVSRRRDYRSRRYDDAIRTLQVLSYALSDALSD